MTDYTETATAEIVQGFEILLGHLGREWQKEADLQAQIVQNDLVRLPDDRRQETVALMQAAAASNDHGEAACLAIGIPMPERCDTVDAILDGVAAELVERLDDAGGQDRDATLAGLFEQMALMPPIMADRYRGLLIDRGLARANLIDAELARRRNGAEPDEPGEPQQETGQRGRPRKYKLVTDDYIALYQKWGYKVHLNLCQDDVEVNGEYLGDIQLDTIFSKVRDYGTNTKTSVNVQHAKESLSVLAARHSYHPIKDYLDALTWDGKENILALSNYLIGVDDKAQRHVMQWLYHWCVAAVAKIYEGYQSPMLVLDAPQDAGKDYFARWLCPLPEYFIESPIVPDSKDHRLRLVQTFVWDVAELGSTTRRADVEALKAFITLGKVRERKPYGKREIIKPALASFIGTINNDAGFLVDRTGNRRFLVCALKAFDWSYTQHVDVHQIWAQAVHVYKSGDGDWKLDTAAKAERDEINEGYMIDTPTEVRLEALYEFTDDPTDIVLLNTILNDLGIYNVKETTGVTMAIAGTLKKWGAVKDRREKKGVKERFYRKIRAKTRPTDQPDQPSL